MTETIKHLLTRFWALPFPVQQFTYFALVGFLLGLLNMWGRPQPFIEFIDTFVFFVLIGGTYALTAALVICLKNLIAARTGSTVTGWAVALLVGIGIGAVVFYGVFYLFTLFSFKLRGLPITQIEDLHRIQMAGGVR